MLVGAVTGCQTEAANFPACLTQRCGLPVGHALLTEAPELRTCTSGIAMEQLYASQSQPVCEGTLCVARDRVKAQSRRKYIFTDQIDRLIREVYLNHRDAKTRPGIRPLAKKVGMPHWALKKRARELGLARTKELPWSEPELVI